MAQAPGSVRENVGVPKWNQGAARLFILTLVAATVAVFAQGQRGRTIAVRSIPASVSKSVDHRSQVESESNRAARILNFFF